MSRREPMGSGECSTECPYIKDGKGRHCLTHPIPGGSVDGKCCGCGITREELAKPVTPKNADHRCRCGHIKYAHEESQGRCGVGRNGSIRCGCQVFVCDHSRCGWKPREECQHPDKQFTGSLYDGPGGRKSWLYYTCPDCKAKWREEKPEQCDHPDNDPCDRCLPGEPEPPLTPEEEEQAPEDEHRCTCGETACESESCDCDSVPCPVDHAREAAEAAQEALEDDWKPPQPERRPPYLVGYSVAGHLYEVALPGDAVVQAVDGALVIKHRLGFVAGIAHVAPLVNEGGA
jgi:hypothetical protein